MALSSSVWRQNDLCAITLVLVDRCFFWMLWTKIIGINLRLVFILDIVILTRTQKGVNFKIWTFYFLFIFIFAKWPSFQIIYVSWKTFCYFILNICLEGIKFQNFACLKGVFEYLFFIQFWYWFSLWIDCIQGTGSMSTYFLNRMWFPRLWCLSPLHSCSF
jgi:hypothetical protein